ncbi:hypothetical protein AQJ91_05675 [Streptomyces dysideae]|uniref:Uncharacterized protein n=1 Tax=Streptomyces dysideae TaxID=909626 RepID=A0A101V462_9ACTN|nr:hypothetical protein AQJ91_05675 [Streptomyces dysideae]
MPPETPARRSVGRCAGGGEAEPGGSGATGQPAPAVPVCGAEPFMAIVGLSPGRAGTADRSYPHAPQKRSPDSSGSSQLGHFDKAVGWGICDINYTHVRGR